MGFEEKFTGIDSDAYEISRPVSVWLEQRILANTIALLIGVEATSTSRLRAGATSATLTPNVGDRPISGIGGYFYFIPVAVTPGGSGYEVEMFMTSRQIDNGGTPSQAIVDFYVDIFDPTFNKIGQEVLQIQPGADEYSHQRVEINFSEEYKGEKEYAVLGIRCGNMVSNTSATPETSLKLDSDREIAHVVVVEQNAPDFEPLGPSEVSPECCFIYGNDNDSIYNQLGNIELLGMESVTGVKLACTSAIGQTKANWTWTLRQSAFFQVASVSVRPLAAPENAYDYRFAVPEPDAEHVSIPINASLSRLVDARSSGILGAFGSRGKLATGQGSTSWPDNYQMVWDYVRGDTGFTDLLDFSMDIAGNNSVVQVPLYLIPTIHSIRGITLTEVLSYAGVYDLRILVRQLSEEGNWADAAIVFDKTLEDLTFVTYETALEAGVNFLATQAILQGGIENVPALLQNSEYFGFREGIIYPGDIPLMEAYLVEAELALADPTYPIRVTLQARLSSNELPGFDQHDDMNQLRLTCVGWSAQEVNND